MGQKVYKVLREGTAGLYSINWYTSANMRIEPFICYPINRSITYPHMFVFLDLYLAQQYQRTGGGVIYEGEAPEVFAVPERILKNPTKQTIKAFWENPAAFPRQELALPPLESYTCNTLLLQRRIEPAYQ